MPRADEVNELKQREHKNFVKDNVKKAVFEMQPPQKNNSQSPALAAANKNYGKVPSYINKFKSQKEEMMKKAAEELEMSRHPPGTRLMPEEERQETLRDLREAKEETNK